MKSNSSKLSAQASLIPASIRSFPGEQCATAERKPPFQAQRLLLPIVYKSIAAILSPSTRAQARTLFLLNSSGTISRTNDCADDAAKQDLTFCRSKCSDKNASGSESGETFSGANSRTVRLL